MKTQKDSSRRYYHAWGGILYSVYRAIQEFIKLRGCSNQVTLSKNFCYLMIKHVTKTVQSVRLRPECTAYYSRGSSMLGLFRLSAGHFCG
jgi:hypothetical protein